MARRQRSSAAVLLLWCALHLRGIDANGDDSDNVSATVTLTTTASVTGTVTGAPTCRGSDAVPVDAASTNCSATMPAGAECQAVCASGSSARGSFVCRAGEMWSASVCVRSSGNITTVSVSTVVGAFAVLLPACPAQEALTSIMSTTFGINAEEVLSASCKVPASTRRLRRLQSAQQLHIGYELVANSSGTSALVQIADQVVANGTAANTRFLGGFTAAGLTAPGSISAAIAPSIITGVMLVVDPAGGYVTRPSPTPAPSPGPEEDTVDKRLVAGLVIGGACILGGLGCLLVVFCKRRTQNRADGSLV
eukprot:CAMPEP_0168417078 /NCGR_PEP_ID=MMETSP0228-20121227/31072_1 /TAXON_ID=133427 /ORGANISM="Protoceratium reticulatum, Strain CCCM 535 (=CCMP 1889)" /LENGTH=307 /DNA_ID=CAMNT_0008430927 /DNA_START=55 /DNA_END=978 /DNA_ORIENTATION=+